MDVEMELVPEHQCGEGRCRDMFLEFVYIVIIPGGTLFLTVFIISILICCSSCKRKQKETTADETQLLRYNSIRRASQNLRHLTHNRDTPLLSAKAEREGRTASLYLERDSHYRRGIRPGTISAPGTLQRDKDRHQRHSRARNSDLIPPNYNASQKYPSEGEINRGSGVEYAEVHHGVTAPETESHHERLVE